MNFFAFSVANLLLMVAGIAFAWIFFAAVVGDFADKKGHSGDLWFGLSIICSPLVGFVVVALLPSAADLTAVGYAPCLNCFRT